MGDSQIDVTLDCVGFSKTLTTALKVTRSGGVVCLVGMGHTEMTVPLTPAAARLFYGPGCLFHFAVLPSPIYNSVRSPQGVSSAISVRFLQKFTQCFHRSQCFCRSMSNRMVYGVELVVPIMEFPVASLLASIDSSNFFSGITIASAGK